MTKTTSIKHYGKNFNVKFSYTFNITFVERLNFGTTALSTKFCNYLYLNISLLLFSQKTISLLYL